ncbi:rhamnulokinase [Tessaracoccus sp. OS52]|uniref:rhamnulokinase n=1 Tax=Tessaracoccus sp. OS52 TaxID=2886691 RepID=UPI001D1279AD|nr:rhamnulokinase family protein [Tessaracoccus sp. OS52]MCC2592566.1 rhamnulokinase [Tessaracoccus sp. OS52]
MAAVDLGASSGRVIAGTLERGRFVLKEAARFPNGPVAVPTQLGPRLYWDVLRLWDSVVGGLRAASHDVGPLESVGIDTWAVDYGLLDADGELLGNPSSYRCQRTVDAPARLFSQLPAEDLYSMVGLQVQPFNTVFQLVAERPERLASARDLLLIPDLLGYWLTGRRVAEVTNASTTGLLDPMTRRWRAEVIDVLAGAFSKDIRPLLGDLVEPGHVVGPINSGAAELTTASGAPTPLVAVGTHDTASAVVAIPAEREDFAYISCGTWSLVGLELQRPVVTPAAREANLTNELGVDGTVRFLKNVMGLWVFNEAVRTWESRRTTVDIPTLVKQAAAVPALRTVVDVDDPVFFAPGDMPERIAEVARRTGQPQPTSPAEFARCIFDSLAIAYARAVRRSAEVAGRDVGVIHMVGGGVRNELLCQLTSDATGLPVIAGPVEGTALGNLVVQARAVGLLEGGLSELRDVVRASSELRTYQPVGATADWDRAAARIA